MLTHLIFHHIHRIRIIAVTLAVSVCKIHLYTFLFPEYLFKPVIIFFTHMDLLCLDQISILVREQIRIDLSVRIKAERCQK